MSLEFQPSPYTNSKEKRVVDIAFSAALLPFAIPAMGIIGLAIKLEDRGSIVFTQKRIGKDGQVFTIHKLRTMNNKGERTRVGQLVRPLGLDELPQLFNIIKGEMSAFGIRSLTPEDFEYMCNLHIKEPDVFSEEFTRKWKQAYLSARTGGLSLAASRAPSVLNRGYGNSEGLRQKLKYDIEQVKTETLQMDLEIVSTIIHRLLEPQQNLGFIE